MSALKYYYHEERGEFDGYVEDEMGNVIYEMHYPEFYEDDETGEIIESSTIFEDGFMENADDTEGLRKYLLSMRLINEDDEVIHESEYKSNYNDGGVTSAAYGHGTTLLEEGGEMDIEEEDKEENEIDEHLESISDDTGIPVDVLKSYADEIGTDYMDLTNDIPYNGSFGTQEDFAEHLLDKGLIVITDLSNYLYMTDTDIRILASEEADARLDGMDDEDIAELAGKSDEYEELKEDLERLEELKDEVEVLKSDIKEKKDAFDHENATEEEREEFDEDIKSDEEELENAQEQLESLGYKLEYASVEDFIDDIRDDALSNANDEITEELEKDAVGYFENLGYSQQDLANHSLFSIDYEKLAEDISYDYVFIEGEDGNYHIFNNYARGGKLEHGGDVADSNLHMLKNQAEQFEHHAKELQEALSKSPRVDAWVVAKAERAATDLSDITHYLEGVNNTHSDSDGEDVIKMDVPLFIRSQEYAREDAKSDADLHEFADNAIDLSQSGETLEMDDYNKLVPNHMAKGGETNKISVGDKFVKTSYYNDIYFTIISINKSQKTAKVKIDYTVQSQGNYLGFFDRSKQIIMSLDKINKNISSGTWRKLDYKAKGGQTKKFIGGVIASSSSKDGIQKLISEYYYGSKITLNKVGDAYEVSNAKGRVKGVKVVEKNGRYQFVNDTKMMARGGVNFGASFDKLKKEILDPNIYSPRDLKVGETYEWTIGAEPLKVKYLGLADENEDKKAGSSMGKGFLFEWVHDAGKYVELGRNSINQILRKITGYARGGFNQYGEAYGFDSNDDTDSVYEYHYKEGFENPHQVWDKIDGKYVAEFSSRQRAIEWIERNRTYAKGGSIENRVKKKLAENFELPLELVVYVPSTEKANQIISKREFISRIDNVRSYLANLFGGYSSEGVDGGYVSVEKGLIQEDVNKVTAFAPKENFEQKLQSLITQIKKWCGEWGQESIGFEFEGDLFYISKDGKFMDGGGEVDEDDYAKGGATFDDKVKAISTSLEGKEVPKRLRKDYGKKYNKKEAIEAARRIAGSMRAKEMKK